jgi:hypothetical protein
VFCGDLIWCGLTMEVARERLPLLLEYGKERGTYFEVVALTDTGIRNRSRQECERHLIEIERVCQEYGNATIEGGNEIAPVHETQRGDIQDICRAFRPTGIMYCPGSVHGGGACTEEQFMTETQLKVWREEQKPPYWDEISFFHGDYGTSHIKDHESPYEAERHTRELEGSSRDRGVPWWANEQRGAGEVDNRRSTFTTLFFMQGLHARIFEMGRTFHSQEGLWARPLGPRQRECAKAFIHGATLIPVDGPRLSFKNAKWPDSPVGNANFRDDSNPSGTVTRCFSAVAGNWGITEALEVTGDPRIEWANGWRPVQEIARYEQVIVWEIKR